MEDLGFDVSQCSEHAAVLLATLRSQSTLQGCQNMADKDLKELWREIGPTDPFDSELIICIYHEMCRRRLL